MVQRHKTDFKTPPVTLTISLCHLSHKTSMQNKKKKVRRWVNCSVFKKHNNHLWCSFLSTSLSSHVLQHNCKTVGFPSVHVKMRPIDWVGAEHREMLMVCGWALSDLLIGRQVTHPPTPHFPYCTADMAKLKPVVGVPFQGRFGVKTYLHYLQVTGFSFIYNVYVAVFHTCQDHPGPIRERVCYIHCPSFIFCMLLLTVFQNSSSELL